MINNLRSRQLAASRSFPFDGTWTNFPSRSGMADNAASGRFGPASSAVSGAVAVGEFFAESGQFCLYCG
jgi:hypothetical protein